jgi:hypothetical protein
MNILLLAWQQDRQRLADIREAGLMVELVGRLLLGLGLV